VPDVLAKVKGEGRACCFLFGSFDIGRSWVLPDSDTAEPVARWVEDEGADGVVRGDCGGIPEGAGTFGCHVDDIDAGCAGLPVEKS